LAKLFRIGISKGEQFITIEEEIEHIKSYLTIQKMRYKDKFNYSIDVDSSILTLKTIKIILQPFVENAIYHGIKNKPGQGKIEIKGRKEKSGILFQIIDDGIGMPEERMKEVFYPPDGTLETEKYVPATLGVGIGNVRERIKLYFGDKFGITCFSSNGFGTRIEIYLPVIKDRPQ
jgi:two-component system, sensor histidine kinase YesM